MEIEFKKRKFHVLKLDSNGMSEKDYGNWTGYSVLQADCSSAWLDDVPVGGSGIIEVDYGPDGWDKLKVIRLPDNTPIPDDRTWLGKFLDYIFGNDYSEMYSEIK